MKWNTGLYNEKHSFVYEYGESLIALLEAQPDDRILDLGCGTGELTKSIGLLTKNVVGMDASPDMVSTAKKSFPEIEFQEKDATHFDFDIPFDAIFSNATLHWVLDYEFCIKSMYRNLKDGGKVVLEFGGKGNVQAIVKCLRKRLKEYDYLKQSSLVQWYFPSIGEYTQVLEKEGFRVTLAQHYDRPTELAESDNGIKDWLNMFAKNFFIDVSEADKEEILNHIQNDLRSKLFSSGKWLADYKRIRIVALKEAL